MQKFVKAFFVSLVLVVLVWCFSLGRPASSSSVLAITNTPTVFTSTPVPTEILTSTPTLRPTSTAVPSATPTATAIPTATTTGVPAATNTPRPAAILPTPLALPPLGIGDILKESGLDSPVTRIQIPALKLDSGVKRVTYAGGAWDISSLGRWVGWLETTSLPDLGGNTVLIGHLDLQGGADGPFLQLAQLKPGMEIVVTSEEILYHFRVIQQRVVESNDITVLDQTGFPKLTLLTCFEPSWDIKAQTYRQRLIIVAEPLRNAP